jgi:hypothetical protein
MLEIKKMYASFHKELVTKEVILKSKLEAYSKQRNRLLELLESNNNLLVLNYIEFDNLAKIGYDLPINLYELEFNTLRCENVIQKGLLLDYYTSFIEITKKEIEFKRLVSINNVSNVSIELYRRIIEYLNIEISAVILLGGYYTFSNGIGIIFVKRCKGKISTDYKASLDVLDAIAKEKNIDLYNKYRQKEIKKNDYIKAMKPYVYSAEHPELDKWIVFRNKEIDHYINWLKNRCRLVNKVVFKFVASNYIHTPNRSQVEFATNAKSVEEILYDKRLGFRDKLNIILRYDSTFTMKYKNLEHGI